MSNVFLHLVTQEGTSAMLLLANQVPCSQVRNILFCFITTLLAYQVAHKVNFFLQDWNISFNFLILRKQWLYYLHWVSVSVNGRLRTATRGKMQTEGKMQIEDRRPGVKCRLKTEDLGLWKMCEIYEHFWFLSMIKLKKNLRLLIALNLFQSIYGRLCQFSSE